MNVVMNHAGIAQFVLIGLLSGIVIDVIRELKPKSDVLRYLLVVAFILPFSLVVTDDFKSGVALLLGTSIGIFMFSKYSK